MRGLAVATEQAEDGAIRFGLLESIRQYAREKLKDEDSIEQSLSGAQANKDTESRHAKHYSQFGQKTWKNSTTAKPKTIEGIFEELNNLLLVLNMALVM